MSLKLISALAKGYFAISEEGVHGYFPIAQSILNGSYVYKAEELPDDVFEPDECADEDEPLTQSDEFTGRIAVMSITGVLFHYGGMCSYGAVDYANRIDAYRNDESISGLIIKGNGPGGEVYGTTTLKEAIDNFAAVKPLIVLVDDGTIASALVWGFSGATELYASNGICQVGSVGVMACFMDVRKAMEMNGFKEVVIYAPQSVDKNKDTTDALDGKVAAVQNKLKFLCQTFIDGVSAARSAKLTSDEWNTGKMFFAEDAQRIGLIDGIKNYPDVVSRMQELIAQNQNQNKMFGNKLPKVAALKGAATITAEDLAAANEEIQAFGIPGVTLCLDSELETAATASTQLTALQGQVTAKDSQITELTNKVTALEAKVATKPAVQSTSVAAEADTIQETGAVDTFETSIDREMKAQQAEWPTN